MKKFVIITTIHSNLKVIKNFEKRTDWSVIIVGDKKSVPISSSKNVTFLSIEEQEKLNYQLVKFCPYNHYARKNIGYLYAMQHGADVIYDTDDDNYPLNNWHLPEFICKQKCVASDKFVNMYRYFTKELVWPRGYPLDEIHSEGDYKQEETIPVKIGVWQGLVNNDPDVDAIFRLTLNKKIRFQKNGALFLEKGYYCPFNSQNTFWHKKAFPYLYLPATTSFRFTDILRGYIAQRLFWEQNLHLGFTTPSVYQKRNTHSLLKDFKDEMEGYVNVKPIVTMIDTFNLKGRTPFSAMKSIYEVLSQKGLIKNQELPILDAWIQDYATFDSHDTVSS